MSKWVWGVLAVCMSASLALAAEQPDPDQLKTLYEDALKQLEAAQTRKNELAAENEALKAKLTEANKQLLATQQTLDKLQQQAAEWAEQTYFYRSYYAAWKQFLRRHPRLLTYWNAYLDEGAIGPGTDTSEWFDPNWPLSTGQP